MWTCLMLLWNKVCSGFHLLFRGGDSHDITEHIRNYVARAYRSNDSRDSWRVKHKAGRHQANCVVPAFCVFRKKIRPRKIRTAL